MNTTYIDEQMLIGQSTVWQSFRRPTTSWDDILGHMGTLWDEQMLGFSKIPMSFVVSHSDRISSLADFMFEFNNETKQSYQIFDIHCFVALGSRGMIHDPQVWDFNNLIWQVKGHSEIAFYEPDGSGGKAQIFAPGDLAYVNPKNKFSIKPISEGCFVSYAMKKNLSS